MEWSVSETPFFLLREAAAVGYGWFNNELDVSPTALKWTVHLTTLGQGLGASASVEAAGSFTCTAPATGAMSGGAKRT